LKRKRIFPGDGARGLASARSRSPGHFFAEQGHHRSLHQFMAVPGGIDDQLASMVMAPTWPAVSRRTTRPACWKGAWHPNRRNPIAPPQATRRWVKERLPVAHPYPVGTSRSGSPWRERPSPLRANAATENGEQGNGPYRAQPTRTRS